MIYKDFIDDLLDRLKLDNNVSNRVISGRRINQAYKDISNAADWVQLKRIGEILSVANYTDGQSTTTKDSRTVTGTGTWTVDMEGRYFKPSNSSNWYKIIKFVSASEITLETPIIEVGQTGDYTIWKRFYYLNSDVKKIMLFGSWQRDGQLEGKSEQWIQDHSQSIANTDVPENYSIYGADPFEFSYTGTASVTVNSDLMTGSGTAWLSNVTPGDIIEIGTLIYRVKRVESDTRIRMINSASSTLSNVSSTIRRDNPLGIQFNFTPDKAYVFPYSYQKRVFNMVNEAKDKPELDEDFDGAISDLAEATRMSDLKDDAAQYKLGLAMARIRDLKITKLLPDQRRTRQLIPRIISRRGY